VIVVVQFSQLKIGETFHLGESKIVLTKISETKAKDEEGTEWPVTRHQLVTLP
jgi:hypothetical protein